MASGIAVNDKCVETFNSIKNRTYRAATFKINEDMTEILLDKTFEPSGSSPLDDWRALEKVLPEDDCRYIVYDFVYDHQGAKKTRVLFVLWSPEGSKVRAKMIYASSQEGIVTKLKGVQRQLQCTDRDEIEYEKIAKALSSFTASY